MGILEMITGSSSQKIRLDETYNLIDVCDSCGRESQEIGFIRLRETVTESSILGSKERSFDENRQCPKCINDPDKKHNALVKTLAHYSPDDYTYRAEYRNGKWTVADPENNFMKIEGKLDPPPEKIKEVVKQTSTDSVIVYEMKNIVIGCTLIGEDIDFGLSDFEEFGVSENERNSVSYSDYIYPMKERTGEYDSPIEIHDLNGENIDSVLSGEIGDIDKVSEEIARLHKSDVFENTEGNFVNWVPGTCPECDSQAERYFVHKIDGDYVIEHRHGTNGNPCNKIIGSLTT